VVGWARDKDTPVQAAQVTVMEKWLTPKRLFQPRPSAQRG